MNGPEDEPTGEAGDNEFESTSEAELSQTSAADLGEAVE